MSLFVNHDKLRTNNVRIMNNVVKRNPTYEPSTISTYTITSITPPTAATTAHLEVPAISFQTLPAELAVGVADPITSLAPAAVRVMMLLVIVPLIVTCVTGAVVPVGI